MSLYILNYILYNSKNIIHNIVSGEVFLGAGDDIGFHVLIIEFNRVPRII